MENKENTSYIIETLGQMQQTLITLSQNQTLLFEQYKALDKKIDSNYTKLDTKINNNYAKLDAKITKNYEAIQQNHTAIISVQKDVRDLRTDVDIVYDLEKDSRKQIRQLL